MKARLAIITLFLLSTACVVAQVPVYGKVPIPYPGVPSGACTPNTIATNMATGDLYSCANGAWSLVSGSGGPPSGSAGGALTGAYPNPTLGASALSDYQFPIVSTSINQEINGATYASPELAVAAACAAPSKEVYFPAGIYTVTTGMQACQGLHIRCAAPSLKAQNSGVVFQLQAGAAVWGLYNPGANAQVTAGAGAINSMVVDGCGFDISQDSAALGAFQVKGISSSQFYGLTGVSNNNPNPVITLDGGNYAYNYGDYDNDWFGINLFDLDGATGSDVGLYFTNTQTTGGSNSNHFHGGSAARYGTTFLIDSGNNNSVDGMDLENFNNYAVHLTTNGSVGGAAGQNTFSNNRIESAAGSRTGFLVDSGAVGNIITHPYFSGAFTYVTDNSGLLTCHGCFYGTTPTASTAFEGLSASNPYHNMGIGGQPNCNDGWLFGCLSIVGELSATRNISVGGNGGYTTQYSTATAARQVIWPDTGGAVLLSGGNVPLSAQGTATPSTNYSSAFLQFLSSYYSGIVTAAGYTSGITATGTVGQTCTLTAFNGGGSGATATIALTGTNTIAAGSSLTITAGGSGYTSAPTSATAGNGTATCSGTAVITAVAASQDTFQCETAPGTGTNPIVSMICNVGGSSGGHRMLWENSNWYWYNTTAATSGANQPAPYVQWLGSYYTPGATSASDLIQCTPTMGTGTNPTSYMNCSHSGTPGGHWWQFPALSINGSNNPVTSTSSTGTQVVTCATGGTGTQYCGADGNWHTTASAGGGLPSGCNQAPCQVAQVASALNSSITASTGFTTFYTTTQAGEYQMCAFIKVTVAGTVSGSGTIQAFSSYVGDAVTLTPTIGSTVAAQTVNSSNSAATPCTNFYADTATAVKWDLNVVGTITASPTIRYGFQLFYVGS